VDIPGFYFFAKSLKYRKKNKMNLFAKKRCRLKKIESLALFHAEAEA